jgi:hypothetical protein
MTKKEVRQITFEDLKELLRNPFQALVEEGDTTHICEYGDQRNKVIEEVSLSSEVHKLLRHLGSSNIIHKGKWGNNIVSDLPDFASFYDIHRGDIYSKQTDEQYALAVSLDLAESK